jgi:hypothetical protein
VIAKDVLARHDVFFSDREGLFVLLLEVCLWNNAICGQSVIPAYLEQIRTPGCSIRGIEGCMRKSQVGEVSVMFRIEVVEKQLYDFCLRLHGVVWGEEEHHVEERRRSISHDEE